MTHTVNDKHNDVIVTQEKECQQLWNQRCKIENMVKTKQTLRNSRSPKLREAVMI